MPIYEASERVLRAFQDELMPAESLSEIFDVVGQYTNNASSFCVCELIVGRVSLYETRIQPGCNLLNFVS